MILIDHSILTARENYDPVRVICQFLNENSDGRLKLPYFVSMISLPLSDDEENLKHLFGVDEFVRKPIYKKVIYQLLENSGILIP